MFAKMPIIVWKPKSRNN